MRLIFPRAPGTCWRVLDCSLLFSLSDASIMETVCWQQISLHISFLVKLPGLCHKQFSCKAGGRGQHSCKVSDCSRGWRSLLDFSRRNCREWMLLSIGEKCWRPGIHQTSFSIDTSRLLLVQTVLSNPVNYELMKNSSAKKVWITSVACDMVISFSALNVMLEVKLKMLIQNCRLAYFKSVSI